MANEVTSPEEAARLFMERIAKPIERRFDLAALAGDIETEAAAILNDPQATASKRRLAENAQQFVAAMKSHLQAGNAPAAAVMALKAGAAAERAGLLDLVTTGHKAKTGVKRAQGKRSEKAQTERQKLIAEVARYRKSHPKSSRMEACKAVAKRCKAGWRTLYDAVGPDPE